MIEKIKIIKKKKIQVKVKYGPGHIIAPGRPGSTDTNAAE